MSVIFAVFCIVGVGYAIFSGNLAEVSTAALDGGRLAVDLTISLCGMMGLWGGIMRVLEKCGAASRLGKLMKPMMRLVFVDACRKNNGVDEIAAALSANMLGMGNATTPLSLRAMEKLRENSPDGRVSPDMAVFCVMSCFPFTLLPTTLIALRRAAGSNEPTAVVIPIWIVSLCCTVLAAILARIVFLVGKKR